jgi:RNA polymerase sigma factor (sigma-70 family)
MNVRPESDETLVKRLLPQANPDARDRLMAWGEWYTRIGAGSVLAFIRAKNDTIELDMDIFQEAMLTAFMEVERGKYEPCAGIPLTAYVKGIARNKIREARRQARRLLPLEETPECWLESSQPHPDTTLELEEQQHALYAGLAALTHGRRQVLEGFLGGESTMEIAQALGMTEELVRQHKSRGLRSLREMNVLTQYR